MFLVWGNLVSISQEVVCGRVGPILNGGHLRPQHTLSVIFLGGTRNRL
ncbi:MAG: hypothetical protein IPL78_15505 [Chloroflexi bacterium]|nr:hypothetical protein [Chloroflexota bacterium]